MNSFGQGIKVAGVGLGLVILTVLGEALNGFLIGVIVAALFFVAGIVVAAQGQLLRAMLDTAVHSSPFLTDDLKAVVMSLHETERSEPNPATVDHPLQGPFASDMAGDNRQEFAHARDTEVSPLLPLRV